MLNTNKLVINSYLSFKLEEEIYAANVNKVLNILEMTRITKVPKTPPYLKGVINLRGTVLPVIDTRVKLDLNATEYTTDTCILVLDIAVDNESLHVGALVDAVQEVLEINEKEIQPPPNIGNIFRSEFITGMFKLNDEQFIMLLDLDCVFSSDEILDLKEMSKEVKMDK